MSNLLHVVTILGCKNSMVREGLKHVLSGTRYKVHPEDLVQRDPAQPLLSGEAPLLLVVDANLYPDSMADAIQSLKAQYPDARIVVLTDNFDLNAMMSALQAGVDGYCLATIGCDALIKYLDLVMLGEVVFPSAIFLSALSEADKALSVHQSDPAEDTRPLQTTRLTEAANLPGRTLSSREAEILRCLTQGAPNKVIARKLDVAEATVKVHIKAILRKIRVSNRTQAAMWAVAHLPTTGSGDSLTPTR
jgi:two-component system, NarL family, nitrate/nitrite response regulator NarL